MADHKSNIDKQIERILAILKFDSEEKAEVKEISLKKYLKYIRNNIVFPCIITGIKDFDWEEFYVIGPGNKEEYGKLKKTR